MKPTFFLSYDLENDDDLRQLMFNEVNKPNFPLSLRFYSERDVDNATTRERIRACDKVVFLCGETTHEPGNVDREFVIATEEQKPYYLLWGRQGRLCSPPPSAPQSDNLHQWSWEVMEKIAAGA